jgi:hypothetical protein
MKSLSNNSLISNNSGGGKSLRGLRGLSKGSRDNINAVPKEDNGSVFLKKSKLEMGKVNIPEKPKLKKIIYNW